MRKIGFIFSLAVLISLTLGAVGVMAQEVSPLPSSTPEPTATAGTVSTPTPIPEPTATAGTMITPTPMPPGDGELPSSFELSVILTWLFEGIGGAVVAYWLLGRSTRYAALNAEWKRYVAIGATALIACAAYVAATALNFVPAPDGAQAWLEKLIMVAGLAVTGGQVLHGRLQLRARLYEMLGVAQVTVTSADLVRMFIGDAAEGVDELKVRVEAAGGIKAFIDGHAFYSSLLANHRAHVEVYYASVTVQNTLKDVRLAADAAAKAAGLPVTAGAWED